MTSSLTIITDTRSVIVSGDNLVLDLRQPTGAEHAAEVFVEAREVAASAPATHEGDRANMEQCDVESSALRASSAVKVGATNSPDGAAVSARSGRPEGGKRLQVLRGPNHAAEPDVGQPKREEDGIERLIETSVTAGETAIYSNQSGRNGPALPVEAATEKQAACASRPNNSNLQVLSEPANAGEIDPSQASPAPHSTWATVDKTGRAGEHPSAPVTLSTIKLRPHCRRPELCGSGTRDHCHSCKLAMAEGEAA